MSGVEKMAEVLFTVIVPIYRVEKYIRKCVDSIIEQSFCNFELILVDDGSPDNCPLICDEYANKDSRVRVIHKKNGGLVSARNTGIEAAKGEYICFVDGDDWVHKDLLKKVYTEAISEYNPDLIVYGIVKKYENKDENIFTNIEDGYYTRRLMEEKIFPYLMYDCRVPFCRGLIFPAACNKIYRKKLLADHCCSNLSIRMGEDVAFVYESILHANSVYILNEILYFYNQLNSGAISQTYDLNRFKNNKMLFDYLDKNIITENNVIRNQLNALKAYWLIMAFFHEVKCHKKILDSSKHIRSELNETQIHKYILLKGLPFKAKVFLILVNCNMIETALLGTKFINYWREK